MKKEKPKKIIYYTDEQNDDFAGTNIKKNNIDENFKFVHKNPVWNLLSFLIYYLVALPIAWIYVRIILQVKFVNKKSVKKYKHQPYFLFGNHTSNFDALTANLISIPRRNKIIASPDAVSIKGLKIIIQMLGAVPIPSTFGGMKKFVKAIDYLHKTCNITIYPEAHLWPYYTEVRPFKDTSFSYAVKNNAPTFALFTAYSKPCGFLSFFRKANITIYISDALFPKPRLTEKEAQKDLRNKVYNFMLEKSKHSTYEVIKYIKKE